jgi:hypothetical protein
MPLPRLEDLDRRLDRTTTDILGDTIRYKPASSPAYTAIAAFLDYRGMEVSFSGAEVVAQDIKVSVLKADVPAKPNGEVRVILPKIPGRTFKPLNVDDDESGTSWVFQLKDVKPLA